MESYTITLALYIGAVPVWEDVTGYVRISDGIKIKRGIDGTGITDRVASVGTMTFSLNNFSKDGSGIVGYFSPDSSNCIENFDIGVPARFLITYSGTDYYKFYGHISNISPRTGKKRERYVSITCVDYMNELLYHYMDGLNVQLNQRADQLISTIIGNLPTAPLATNYDTGTEIFPYALYDVKDEKTTAMEAVQRVCQSDLSYLYLKGCVSSDGEELVWENRYSRMIITGSGAGPQSEDLREVQIVRDANNIYNSISVTGNPVNAGTTDEILWQNYQEITIQPAQVINLTCRYIDQNGAGTRVAIVPGTGIAPTTDDYRMSSGTSDAGGGLTSDLAVSVSFGGNLAEMTLTNNGPSTGYINLLRLRGNVIRFFDPIESISESSDSIASYGRRTITFNAPYQGNINNLSGFSDELLSRTKDPYTRIDEVEFIANKSAANMASALNGDVGSWAQLDETVSGISTAKDVFYVNTYELEIYQNQIIARYSNLEPASSYAIYYPSVIYDKVGLWGTSNSDAGIWGTTNTDSSRWVY